MLRNFITGFTLNKSFSEYATLFAFALFILVILFAPVLTYMDVNTHNWYPNGIKKDLENITKISEIIHTLYFTGMALSLWGLISSFSFIFGTNSSKDKLKRFLLIILCVIYSIPFIMFLVEIQGYWKSILYFVLDIFKEE
jgi:hypothetical protein